MKWDKNENNEVSQRIDFFQRIFWRARETF